MWGMFWSFLSFLLSQVYFWWVSLEISLSCLGFTYLTRVELMSLRDFFDDIFYAWTNLLCHWTGQRVRYVILGGSSNSTQISRLNWHSSFAYWIFLNLHGLEISPIHFRWQQNYQSQRYIHSWDLFSPQSVFIFLLSFSYIKIPEGY